MTNQKPDPDDLMEICASLADSEQSSEKTYSTTAPYLLDCLITMAREIRSEQEKKTT